MGFARRPRDARGSQSSVWRRRLSITPALRLQCEAIQPAAEVNRCTAMPKTAVTLRNVLSRNLFILPSGLFNDCPPSLSLQRRECNNRLGCRKLCRPTFGLSRRKCSVCSGRSPVGGGSNKCLVQVCLSPRARVAVSPVAGVSGASIHRRHCSA